MLGKVALSLSSYGLLFLILNMLSRCLRIQHHAHIVKGRLGIAQEAIDRLLDTTCAYWVRHKTRHRDPPIWQEHILKALQRMLRYLLLV